MTQDEADKLRALIEAAKPFTSGDVVTETSGTISLMEALEDAIAAAETSLQDHVYPSQHDTFREYVNDELRKYLQTQ